VEPAYLEVAVHLKEHMKIGRIDGSQYPTLIEQFEISEYPSILLFLEGADK
jgi:hypothetical protein